MTFAAATSDAGSEKLESSASAPCALVTGAGRGLGRAIAEAFHAKGYLVVATDCDAGLLRDLEGAPGYVTARHDVSDIEAAAEVAALIRERCGRLDVLVNNAGVNSFYPVCESPGRHTCISSSPRDSGDTARTRSPR